MSIKPGRYRHYKGQEYIVIGESTHTETKEQMVIYQQDYEDFKLWVRPKELFEGTVEIGGEVVNRFTYVGPWYCWGWSFPGDEIAITPATLTAWEDRMTYQDIRDRGEKLLEEAKKGQKVIVTAIQKSKEFKPGDKVEYISASGKSYTAIVVEIPENPWHLSTPLPTLSLAFRDETGRLIRKPRVLPISASLHNRKVYREVQRP